MPTSDVASVALNTLGDSDIVGPRAFTPAMAYPAVGGVVSTIDTAVFEQFMKK